nr:BRCT domain-containing protein [Tanacetum cinerariifolium]
MVDVSRDTQHYTITSNHKDNQSIMILAKKGVRNRRVHNIEASQTPIKPLARSILLDSINWNMFKPPSTASVCMDSLSLNDANESMKELDACFVNFLRPLSERERITSTHFISLDVALKQMPFGALSMQCVKWYRGVMSVRWRTKS